MCLSANRRKVASGPHGGGNIANAPDRTKRSQALASLNTQLRSSAHMLWKAPRKRSRRSRLGTVAETITPCFVMTNTTLPNYRKHLLIGH
jgi:hypothetical protein